MKVIQPRVFDPRKTAVVAAVLIASIVWMMTMDRPGPRHPGWSGHTMGTTYAVKIANAQLGVKELKRLRQEINEYLQISRK